MLTFIKGYLIISLVSLVLFLFVMKFDCEFTDIDEDFLKNTENH